MGDENTGAMGATSHDMSGHKEMYGYFIQLSIALVLGCTLLLICLAALTMTSGLSAWIGGIGLVVGLVVVFVTLLTGMSWLTSVLVIAGVTALILIL